MANEQLTQIAAMGGTGILILLALLVALVAPMLLVMFSRRVRGGRKTFWVVMTGTFSWLAYLPYLIATRMESRRRPGGN